MALRDFLKRPISFHPIFAKITGSIDAAVFLSQAYYWSERKEDGWFWKTRDQWTEETTLSRFEQESARKKLKALGLLEEKLRDSPAKLYYRVVESELEKILLQLARNSPSNRLETDQQDGEKVTNQLARNSPTFKGTETTTEITSQEVSYDTSPITGDERSDTNLKNLITSQFRRGVKKVAAMSAGEWLRVKFVFRAWRLERGYSKTTKLTPERGRAVLERLRSPLGWTDGQFEEAMRGVKYLAHNSGLNETGTVFDDLELICRHDQHMQRFVDAYEKGINNGQQPFEIPRLTGRDARPGGNGSKSQRTAEAISANANDPAFNQR